MMAWLLDEAKHSGFELRGSTVLIYYLLFSDPNDLDWFLDRAIGFRDHIPRVVGERWRIRSCPVSRSRKT